MNLERFLSRSALAGLLVLAVAPSEAAERMRLPGIKGADDRALVDSAAYPWSAIGRINRETGGFCTGTLVGPRYVLTAAHCLWNARTRRWLRPRSIHFVAGYRRGGYVRHSRAASYEVAEKYQPDGNKKSVNVARDWALITLRTSMSDAITPLSAASSHRWQAVRAPNPSATLIQAGYNQDKAHMLAMHHGCSLIGARHGAAIFLHDCDTTKGSSGSPILIQTRSSYQLVGMHVGTAHLRGRTVGIAISATSFRMPSGTLTR